MSSPSQNPTPARPRFRLRGAQWLDRLLDMTERSSSLRANSVLIAIILTTSVVLSLGLATALRGPMGLPEDPRLLGLVAVIGTVVPLIVRVPAVLFGDALVLKIKGMREDLRAALTAADRANRAKSEFLTNISHEIRTPMNGVLGMAQVLEPPPLSDLQREHLRLIRESGDMLMTIIDDVLDLSRIDAGRIELNPAPHPLPEALADTVALFRGRAEEQGTTLDFVSAPGTPGRAVFDSVRVRQCLGNLVSNAVKFTRDGAVTVTLSAQAAAAGGWDISVTVRDTGIGIDPTAQARLFQAFSQAEATTAQDYGGTGLGLAISRRLARMMGGDITVSSTPGVGSCFVLGFHAGADDAPARDSMSGPDARAGLPAARNGGLCGLSVLVVDDSAVNRKVACGLLTALGARCQEATGGAEALAILAAHPVDLVLLDMQMPAMDGPATLRALRASDRPWAGLPVVALTARAMQGERERCIEMGMQGYVAKPVRKSALQAEILRCIDASGRDGATAGDA